MHMRMPIIISIIIEDLRAIVIILSRVFPRVFRVVSIIYQNFAFVNRFSEFFSFFGTSPNFLRESGEVIVVIPTTFVSPTGRGGLRSKSERGYNGARGGSPLSRSARHLPLNAGEKESGGYCPNPTHSLGTPHAHSSRRGTPRPFARGNPAGRPINLIFSLYPANTYRTIPPSRGRSSLRRIRAPSGGRRAYR